MYENHDIVGKDLISQLFAEELNSLMVIKVFSDFGRKDLLVILLIIFIIIIIIIFLFVP